MDLFSKLASNSKLTSDEYKKHLKNNLYPYCSAEDHKLNSYPKKQTIITSKDCNTLVTANSLVAVFEKSLEK